MSQFCTVIPTYLLATRALVPYMTAQMQMHMPLAPIRSSLQLIHVPCPSGRTSECKMFRSARCALISWLAVSPHAFHVCLFALESRVPLWHRIPPSLIRAAPFTPAARSATWHTMTVAYGRYATSTTSMIIVSWFYSYSQYRATLPLSWLFTCSAHQSPPCVSNFLSCLVWLFFLTTNSSLSTTSISTLQISCGVLSLEENGLCFIS